MTTVLAVAPAFTRFAQTMLGDSFISSRIVGGRGYVLIRGVVGSQEYIDPTDNELLIEVHSFASTDAADAWIASDVEQRRRVS
jgi:hypothetical protein